MTNPRMMRAAVLNCVKPVCTRSVVDAAESMMCGFAIKMPYFRSGLEKNQIANPNVKPPSNAFCMIATAS